ncbi:MAG: hypothetical protein ABEN55_23555 [Bradymonadaceae bacterium]
MFGTLVPRRVPRFRRSCRLFDKHLDSFDPTPDRHLECGSLIRDEKNFEIESCFLIRDDEKFEIKCPRNVSAFASTPRSKSSPHSI